MICKKNKIFPLIIQIDLAESFLAPRFGGECVDNGDKKRRLENHAAFVAAVSGSDPLEEAKGRLKVADPDAG